MKISIFGSSGFLGSQTFEALSETNHSIDAIARPSSLLNRLPSMMNSRVKRLQEIEYPEYLKNTSPQVVIAANWKGVGKKYREDLRIQQDSARQVLELAKTSLELGTETFIAFGSQAESTPSAEPIPEEYMENGSDAYGKVKVELSNDLAELFRGSQTRLCWVRPFSIYGPNDSEESLIPQIYQAASKDMKFEVNNPNLFWSYLHISDFGDAIRSIVENPSISNVINVGNPDKTSILNIAEIVRRRLIKVYPSWGGLDVHANGSTNGRIPAVEKLASVGWVPRVSIEQGIIETVDWQARNQRLRNHGVISYEK